MQKYSYSVLLGVAIGLIVAFLPIPYISPILIVMFGLLVAGFVLVLCNQKDPQDHIFLLNIFILAFLYRIIVAFLFYNFVFVLQGRGLSGDSWPYSENGYRILQMWLSGIHDVKYISYYILQQENISLSGALGTYDFWNALVYFFTGKSPLSLVFINCLAGSLIIVFIYAITKQLFSRKAAVFAAILTAFWPSTFLWSIQNLKEPITIFLICFLVWVILQIRNRFRFYLIVLAIVLAVTLKEFREVAFVVLLLALLLSIFPNSRSGCLALLSCGIIIFLFRHKLKLFLPQFSQGDLFLDWLYRLRGYRASGGSAFLVNFDFTTGPKFIIFMPIALLVAWLAPFPWQLGSLMQISAVPEMIVFYLCIPCMFYGIKFILKNKFKEGFVILLYISIMSLVLALIEGNIGTLFRHRAMILPFCFILIAAGLERYKFKITAHN